MTDRPYTDDDLRAEAARQHASLTAQTDSREVLSRMLDARVQSTATDDGDDGLTWDEALNCGEFDEPANAVTGLIRGAVDVSEWAVKLGADNLQPSTEHEITLNAGRPIARIHFAFEPGMAAEMRTDLVEGIGDAINEAGAQREELTAGIAIPMETAAHVLWQDRLGGWPPSTFATKLLSLWTSADTDNTARLAVAFPDYAAAIALVRSGQDGIQQLRAIAGDS
ncbi:hypothetical protein ACWDBT_30530 [Streptomyces ardesiacus]